MHIAANVFQFLCIQNVMFVFCKGGFLHHLTRNDQQRCFLIPLRFYCSAFYSIRHLRAVVRYTIYKLYVQLDYRMDIVHSIV